MRRFRPPVLFAVIALAALLFIHGIIRLNARAHPRPDLPPFQPTPEFYTAESLFENGDVLGAFLQLEKIIQKNPGTTVAAESILREVKFFNDLDNDLDLPLIGQYLAYQSYHRLVMLFPRTRYEIIGRGELTWFLGRLITHYGGVAPGRIIAAHNVENFRSQLEGLTPAERDGLPILYQKAICECMADRRYDDALKLALFVRQHFPKYPEYEGETYYKRDSCMQESLADLLIETVLYMRFGIHVNTSYFPRDLTPPHIKPIAPHANLTIGETQPKIEVELWDGDISQAQVALDHVVWTLDGQDLTQSMEVGSVIDKSGQLGPIFERLFLTYVPTKPLSSGSHTVFVKAPDNVAIKARTKESHVSTLQWTFTVK